MAKILTLVLLLFALVAFSAPDTRAQTTEFTYQGSLKDGANPANGNYDFEFRLFSVDTGGSAIGTLQRLAVPVSNGTFAVKLDFGAQFPGAARFLEIAVKPAGGPSFQTLGPRQAVSNTPYSVRSLNAANADSATTATNATNAVNATNATTATNALQLGGVAAGQYVLTTDPRMTDPRPPTAGSSNYIQNATSPQAASNFNISGNGTAGIFNATTQYNIGGNRVLSVAGSSNIFAGVGAGAVNTGAANSFFGAGAGAANTDGHSNSFFGLNAGNSNTSGFGNSFFGRLAGTANTTAFGNSFFGRNAGAANTEGDSNSFFGFNTGDSNTTGVRNSFFGIQAGHANMTGQVNSFVGASAGFNNLTGNSNSFFGAGAGETNTEGNVNSFFGVGAGSLNKTGSGNSFVGVSAGDANTTGGNNTIVGSGADVGSGALDFATALGAGVTVNTSNTVVLGRAADTVQVPGGLNVIGTFTASGAGLTGLNASNLSSGTLDVARLPIPLTLSGTSASHIIQGDNASTTNGSSAILGLATGASGITHGVSGLSNSTSGSAVFGQATAATGNTSGVYGLSSSTSGRGVFGGASAASGTTYGVYGESDSTSGIGVYGLAFAATGTSYGVYGQSLSPTGFAGYFLGRGYFGGNVGIGTSSPARRLHVQDGSAGAIAPSSSSSVVLERSGNNFLQMFSPAANETGLLFGSPSLDIRAAILADPTDGLQFRTGGNNTRMTINAAGNLGIGTTTPQAKLDVSGDAVQSLSAGGFVKAMIYADAFGTINRCYNSQATGGAVHTPPCGFSITQATGGHYEIDFGFNVKNRFYSVTPDGNPGNFGAMSDSIASANVNVLIVYTYRSSDATDRTSNRFTVIIF